MKGRPTKASSFNDPGVKDVIAPYRKNSEYKDNFVYITGPAEAMMSFVPCHGTGDEDPVFKDVHTWQGECTNTKPWEVALQGCGDFKVDSISQTDELKKVIVAINYESQISDNEGKTDEELAVERAAEIEEKKKLCTDGTDTVTIERRLWQAKLVFESQAKMMQFTRSSWSTKPFIAGHPSLKILSEGLVICRASGAILSASSIDSHVNSDKFLTNAVASKKPPRTLTQVLQMALNVLQRRMFETDILPLLKAEHEITVVNDHNNVPRFVKVAQGKPPKAGNVALKLIVWGADTLYTRTGLLDGEIINRLPGEIEAELERRLRDVFQINTSDADISVAFPKETVPVLRLLRDDLEFSHRASAEQPYSVVLIDAKPVIANRLLKQKGVHIPYLSKGNFTISTCDLWFDMATHATLDSVDDLSDVLHQVSHPPTTPVTVALKRLVTHGFSAFNGSLYQSTISLPDDFTDETTENTNQEKDDRAEAQFIDKATRGAIIPSARANYNDYVNSLNEEKPDPETVTRLADLKKRFDEMAERHQKQAEKDRQARLTDRGALTAVLFRQHDEDKDSIKVTQRVEGEGARAATTVEVTVKGKVLGTASGFKKNRVEVVKSALSEAVKASPYPEATDEDCELGKEMLNTWWQQVFTYVEEKPPPDEQLEVIRENIQRDQHRETIRSFREDEEYDRRRKAAPIPKASAIPVAQLASTPVPRPGSRVAPAIATPVAPTPVARPAPPGIPRSRQIAAPKPVAIPVQPPVSRGPRSGNSNTSRARSTWNAQAETWFYNLLAEKLVSISSPVIQGLAQQANACVQEGRSGAPEIITALEKRLYSNIPAKLNLATWYLLDAIMKGPNSRQFLQAVTPKMDLLVERTLPNRIDPALTDQCRQLIDTWKNLFSPEVFKTLRRAC
eukprot:TRINITY_DN9106_c0_g1_i1.p1 TRINITY_DN9106_c0_g1~~TRINITY_DN9106_c0_g1_i1.p1  ORF type:complete len:931 (+),score=165.17 TRINITY_DN9106_c0_g1_i1:76-2793(+)